MEKKELGVYIHTPFCKQKCFYCDFISYANKDMLIKDYVDALIKECKSYELKNYEVTSIYMGGGTPSYIDSKYITKIMEAVKKQFAVSDKCEITIEVNPGTVIKQKLKDYKKCGINRLSIGLQTNNNELLKQIGRIHTYEEFLETYKMAKQVNFENINVDLIIGLPNQTIEDVKNEIEDIVKLNPMHVSIYSLIVEEGTILEKMLQENKLKLPEESIERQMYWYVKNNLEKNGYNHYEISNFAKEGKESKHNKNCWEQKEYIGLGVAAHSYLQNAEKIYTRYSNIESLENYILNIKENKIHLNRIVQEVQKQEEQEKEYMLLALRKIEGVSIKDYKNKFAKNPIYLYRKELGLLEKQKLIEVDGDFIKLSKKGIDFANLVWEQFI